MNEYRTALSALHALETFGMRLGLENVAEYCAAAGHPERAWPALHVAGTNGKGTTAACLAALARRDGLRAGLYMSPHLIDFRERIRIDGEPISKEGFVAMWDRVGPFAEGRSMTFFEAGTLMAMEWFAERQVDVAVLEVGLGGRLDATNVVLPVLAIVTNIGLDHERHLGADVAAIAREKAGIFKPGVPALVGEAEVRAVRGELAAVARERGAPIGWLREEAAWEIRSEEAGWTTFDYASDRGRLEGLGLPMAGENFVADAALALRAWERWRGAIDPAVARAAVAAAAPPGRMELRSAGDVSFLFDVAHNPAALDRLIAALPATGVERWTFVAGILADKRWEQMLDALRRVAPRGRLCGLATANPGRRLSAADAGAAVRARPGVEWAESVGEALAAARADVGAGLAAAVLVTGSFHTVGEALVALGFATEGEPYERSAAAPPVAA